MSSVVALTESQKKIEEIAVESPNPWHQSGWYDANPEFAKLCLELHDSKFLLLCEMFSGMTTQHHKILDDQKNDPTYEHHASKKFFNNTLAHQTLGYILIHNCCRALRQGSTHVGTSKAEAIARMEMLNIGKTTANKIINDAIGLGLIGEKLSRKDKRITLLWPRMKHFKSFLSLARERFDLWRNMDIHAVLELLEDEKERGKFYDDYDRFMACEEK